MSFTRAAILGATGPTGIHLAPALRAEGIAVRAVSRSLERLAAAFPEDEIEKVAADVRDVDLALRAVESCDLVFDCIGLPAHRMHDHVVTAKSIGQAIRRTGARCVQVSSYWSYLPLTRARLDEDHPRTGGSPWMRDRRAAEDILLEANAAVLNLPDFYGPHVRVGTLQEALKGAVRGRAMTWIGSADTARDYVYVADAMAIATQVALRERAYGKRWIVPGGGAITANEIAAIAGRHLGRTVRVRAAGVALLRLMALFNRDLRGFMQMVPEYVKPISFDGGRLTALIGEPRVTSYEMGIGQTLDWVRRSLT